MIFEYKNYIIINSKYEKLKCPYKSPIILLLFIYYLYYYIIIRDRIRVIKRDLVRGILVLNYFILYSKNGRLKYHL